MRVDAQNLLVAERVSFARDWTQLNASTTDESRIDMLARLYLYSLKARIYSPAPERQHRRDNAGASEVLNALARLDPEDRVGGSVIMTLAESVEVV